MPAPSSATRIKTLARHEKFGNPRDGLTDPPCFVGGKLGRAKAVALGVIAAVNPRERYTIGVPHHVTFGIFPNEGPGRLEMAA